MDKMPSAANITAAVIRIARTGSLSAILFATRTAGILARHHAQSGARDNRKELLEPCSKASRGDLRLIADFRDEKGTEIAVNAAERLIDRSLPSYLSRNSAHTATLSSESPSIHRIHGTLSTARKRCRPDRRLHG